MIPVVYTFYKNSTILRTTLFSIAIANISILTFVLFMGNRVVIVLVPIGIVDLSMGLLLFFAQKAFFTKVNVSNNGIYLSLGKTIMEKFDWEDFIDTYIIIKYNSRYIQFDTNKSGIKLYLNISSERLTYLKNSCTITELKNKLNSIQLSVFHQKLGPI